MMKLNLIFFAMDLFTLLVYPILFVLGKIKAKENVMLVNLLLIVLTV
jgi:hypothetical protein